MRVRDSLALVGAFGATALLAPAAFSQPAQPEGSAPPSHYYTEPAEPAAGPQPQQPPPRGGYAPPPGQPQPGVYEPPPPGYAYPGVYEPPPPPKPKHRSPKTSLWLGARIGWFLPFGDVWADGEASNNACCFYEGRDWSDYAGSGNMVQLDLGMRLSRYNNLFITWEHANLDTGKNAESEQGAATDATAWGDQTEATSDYYAIGLRFSSDPDEVGFLTEISLGFRRFRAAWANGNELELSQSPFEMRIGLGADIRLTEFFSLSPMVTVGGGYFGEAKYIIDGEEVDARTRFDESTGHGWVTLHIGGHFDVFGAM